MVGQDDPVPLSSRPVLEQGPKWIIVAAVRADSSSPARDFIDALDLGELAKITVQFKRMAEIGRIDNDQKFKSLFDFKCGHRKHKMYEFKTRDYRYLCFQDGNSWVITHGFPKKGQKTPTVEKEKAKRIACEDLDRRSTANRDKG
jgi:phage-related protein